MKPVNLIVIGGSAGSLQVILNILSGLGSSFSIPVLIILHRNSGFDSNLEDLFSTRTRLIVKEVEEKEPVAPGAVYICPADYHILFEADKTFSLDYSERVNFSRPSIDVTFRSAADVFGEGLVCCLLSGGNADGTEGLSYVKQCGGLTVVQDPATAEVPYMPQYAISNAAIDFVLSAEEMPHFIRQLAKFKGA